MKTTFCAIIACLALTGTAFAQTFVCDRERLSTAGFTSKSGAASWFPKEIWFRLDGTSVPESFYGKGTARDNKGRTLLSMKASSTATVRIRLFKDGRASTWLDTGPKFLDTTPSRYACRRVR